MSVYSSDPFVWEKEQAGRAGPEAAWLLEPDLCESVCGSVHCRLSVSKGEYVNTQWAQPSAGLGCLPLLNEKVCVWRGGYKRVLSLEYTAEGLHRNPTGRIYNCNFLSYDPVGLWTYKHSSSQGKV